MDKRILILVVSVVLIVLLVLLVTAPPISAQDPPPLLASWFAPDPQQLDIGPEGDLYAARINGVTRYTPDGTPVQSWEIQDIMDFAVAPNGDLFATTDKRGVPDVQRFDAGGSLIGEWYSKLTPLEDPAAIGIALGPDGLVYVLHLDYKRVVKFTQDGEYVGQWSTVYSGSGPSSPNCILIDEGGYVFLGDYSEAGVGRVKIYTPDGERLRSWSETLPDGSSFLPSDLALDRWGNVYVSDYDYHHGYVFVYTRNGNALGHFRAQESYLSGVAVDDEGNVYAGGVGDDLIQKFSPYGPAFAPVAEAAVMLHVRPAETLDDPCLGAPSSIQDIVTEGQGDPASGGSYYVYVLGSPQKYIGDQSGGINGFRFGIDYHRTGGQSEQAIRIHEWTQCAGLEFPQDAWPGAGSGNTITWGIGDCQTDEIVTAGFFYLSAYSPSRMSVVDYPGTGEVKVANCLGAEMTAQPPLSPIRLGWVALEEAGGCNPLVEPCYGPTPVKRTTWGSLKTRFTGARATADKPRPN